MAGTGLKKSWGLLISSKQEVGPIQWMDYAKQKMAEYNRREIYSKVNILNAVVQVMERLVCNIPMAVDGENVNEVMPGILEFNEAFRIYSGSVETEACAIEQLKLTFQNQLLHHTLGLPVCIISHKLIGKFVILKSASNCIEYILTTLLDELDDVKDPPMNMEISFSEIKSLMSSDFDRKLLDLALSAGKSRKELEVLQINVTAETTEELKKKIDEIRSVDKVAEERARRKLDCEISSAEESIKSDQCKLGIKRSFWPETAIIDLEEKIKVQEEKKEQLEKIKAEANDYCRTLLKRRIRRAKAKYLADERLKEVGRSRVYKKQGAKRKLTDSDDEFVANMFSEHAGYHGLRNTVTEFIGTVDRNKRIKLEDIKKYYNMRRNERGEKSIGVSTARRRLAPKRKTSRAAKSHIGKCLISVAVPPRTGDSTNENTHFARKFRSNLEKCLFSKAKFLTEVRDIQSSSKVLFQSKDDAHYVAPKTKEGFDRARQKKIYCPADVEKRHGVPKYDFPDSTLYQTPGSHRILQKTSINIGQAEEKLARDPDWDHHHVYVRPKITQDSSGLTWSSEDVDLIIKEPFLSSAELEDDCNISKEQFSCLRGIQLEMKLFLMMQNKEDEKFLGYNSVRVVNLYEKLKMYQGVLVGWPEFSELIKSMTEILVLAPEIAEKSVRDQVVFSHVPNSMRLTILLNNCLGLINIPPVRPIRVDMVDSGPGQSPSQKDVQFCDRILFHLLDTNYYARVSLADHDSYMNYAERTNSAISDAMCVGTSIDCDIYNPLDSLSQEEVSNLDSRKFKELSFQAQVKNSHHITQQLVQRINGAPCLGNYITGRIGLPMEDQFLGFLKPFINGILSASDSSKVPGGNFALELGTYADAHSVRGQLYSEQAREKCLILLGGICQQCLDNPQKTGEKLILVPQPEVDMASGLYLDVSDSSFRDRVIDDFLPRKNIDQLYNSHKLASEEEILQCSKKLLVERKLIDKRILHLRLLALKKELRRKDTEDKRRERNVKVFEDYNWEEEIEINNFKNLVVKDLVKYCIKFNLNARGRKDDLKNRVRGHWFTNKGVLNTLEVLQVSVVPRLNVMNAEAEEDIMDLQDMDVDSDSDEVINYEAYSSDSDDSTDEEFL